MLQLLVLPLGFFCFLCAPLARTASVRAVTEPKKSVKGQTEGGDPRRAPKASIGDASEQKKAGRSGEEAGLTGDPKRSSKASADPEPKKAIVPKAEPAPAVPLPGWAEPFRRFFTKVGLRP
jgi:hypothetical protein